MLTKTFDFIKVMCHQYWPTNIDKIETYGDIRVQVVKEERLANFRIRTIEMSKTNESDVSFKTFSDFVSKYFKIT